MKHDRHLAFLLLLLTTPIAAAGEPDGLPDTVVVWSVDGGAGFATGDSFEVEAVIGQPDAGRSRGFGVVLDGGFFGRLVEEDPVFRDDFGSGNTDAWTTTVGGAT